MAKENNWKHVKYSVDIISKESSNEAIIIINSGEKPNELFVLTGDNAYKFLEGIKDVLMCIKETESK